MYKPAAIRACLNTISATDAVFFVNKDNPLRTYKSGTDRANLLTWGFCTVITHFRNKKGFEDILVRNPLDKPVYTSVGGNNINAPVIFDSVLFNPVTKEKRLRRNIIFLLAGLGTVTASYTFLYINPDAIPGKTFIFRLSSVNNEL